MILVVVVIVREKRELDLTRTPKLRDTEKTFDVKDTRGRSYDERAR